MDAAGYDTGIRPEDILERPTTPPRGSIRSADQARAAAEDFEAMFLSQMLQPMFEGISTEAPFGGGNAEKIYRSLLVQEYGKALAKNGGIGLADAVARELMQWQEGQAQ